MKTLKLVALLFACLTLGCTKDRTPEFNQNNYDLTGKWNAYGYYDFGGYVPIEIIEIQRRSNGEYVAYKVVGDNAIRSGDWTWRGRVDVHDGINPNIVEFHTFNGQSHRVENLELIVKSANCIVSEKWIQFTLVRRVE